MTVEIPNFIGLAGRKRSGKDTAAAVLESMGFQKLAFAAPMKHMLSVLLQYQGVDVDVVERMLEGDLKEVPTPFLGGRSPRYALQKLGTEWGRDMMGEDFWVEILVNASDQFPAVVVSDVRFPNEVEILKTKRKAEIFRITRPGLDIPADAHPSENKIDELVVDQEIENAAPSPEAFQQQFFAILMGAEAGDIQ